MPAPSKKTNDPASEIMAIIARVRDEGRQEGVRETMRRLTSLAEGGGFKFDSSTKTLTATRVPMGTAKGLITKALQGAGEKGLAPKDIMEAATTEAEKSVATTTIYNELTRGAKDGRYKRDKQGLWHLGRGA